MQKGSNPFVKPGFLKLIDDPNRRERREIKCLRKKPVNLQATRLSKSDRGRFKLKVSKYLGPVAFRPRLTTGLAFLGNLRHSQQNQNLLSGVRHAHFFMFSQGILTYISNLKRTHTTILDFNWNRDRDRKQQEG